MTPPEAGPRAPVTSRRVDERASSWQPPALADRLADDRRPQPRVWVRALAAACLVLLGMRFTLPQSLQVGFVVALVMLPVWWAHLRRQHGGTIFVGLGLLATVAGLWLGVANAADHETDPTAVIPGTVFLVGTVFSVGLFVWGRDVLTSPRAAFWFGVGLALGFTPETTLFATNPWKFGFALPVTVILLALAARFGRRWELGALASLIVVAALNDSRSAFGLLLLAALLVFAQIAIVRPHRRPSAIAVVVGLGGLGVAVYQLGQALILDGYLGLTTQARSLEQLRQSGSLILGGRPELAATVGLMEHHPWGFGTGSVPTPEDVQIAKEGMNAIGYQPNNGYVERFMFGGHVELHSVFGDLWAQSGIVGLLLVATVVVVLAAGVVRRLADGTASGLLLYAAAQSVWNIFFAPFYTSFPTLVLALALAFLPRREPGVTHVART